jgi:putative transposase
MFVVKHFLSDLVDGYGHYPVFTNGATWYLYQAFHFLKLKKHLHSLYEKSIIGRTMKYIKDKIECFDDYFHCRKKEM